MSTAFSTGAAHALQEGAVIQDIAALHVNIGHSTSVSVSTQIAALRHLLLDAASGTPFYRVAQVSLPYSYYLILVLSRLKYIKGRDPASCPSAECRYHRIVDQAQEGGRGQQKC